ncbi:nucleolar protein, putative [Bodo saltans]|uniref:Nucleolar protein, putative n=1 Tax=Bodo saltans TaxID=75058 RepID=A0A0S4KG56_BODSA|nr:nucleolar protein, putative [Bodo saltans]|eukprot:CUI14649.1 nucleolar protein, putative [Bodo saltans]
MPAKPQAPKPQSTQAPPKKVAKVEIVAPLKKKTIPKAPVFEEEEDEEADYSDEEDVVSGDDEEGSDIDFSDEEDGSDDLNGDINDDDDFEVKAEKHRRRMLKEGRMADAEQKDDVTKRTVKATPLHDLEEADEEQQGDQLVGLAQQHTAEELTDRIKEVLGILGNFSTEREEGRTRDEYLSVLRADLLALFEYNEFLMDCVLDMFPPQEAFEFLEAMEKTRPTTIRTNTIKAKRRDLVQTLIKRGMNIEPLEKWSKVGLQIFETSVPIAGTIEYLAGHYMLQSAVSFLPVMALAPQENERVLDMSAAPGGKTTYIAQLMKNSGVLFANDVSEPRIKSLNANIQRLGVTNCIVSNYDGVGYDRVMKNFDRILLDAPCTGAGIISRDKSIKTSKQAIDVQHSAQQQRKLIVSALDCCKVGGYVVYSTCSFLVEEDEAVVDYALRSRHCEIVEMGLPFGRPGFVKYRHARYHPSVAMSRRYFPHVHNMDGFFVCKLKKLKEGVVGKENTPAPAQPAAKKTATKSQKQALDASGAVEAAKKALLGQRVAPKPAVAPVVTMTAKDLKTSQPPPTQKRPRSSSTSTKGGNGGKGKGSAKRSTKK